jgi:hypothetical protein
MIQLKQQQHTINTNTKKEYLKWNRHAKDRKKERNIEINRLSMDYIATLPYYTNNGCYHYCDGMNGVIYYVRGNTIVTVIKAHPISMLRKVCMIKGWDFNTICRDNLFGNCTRGCRCKYEHKTL